MVKDSVLTRDEERTLGRKARAGDIVARNELVTRNTGYVSMMMSRYSYCTDPDLRQQMFLGLLEAASIFDPDRYDCKFLTIAQHYVKKYALLYLAKRHMVCIPPWVRKELSAVSDQLRSDQELLTADKLTADGCPLKADKLMADGCPLKADKRRAHALIAAQAALRKPIYLSAYPRNGDEVLGAALECESEPSVSEKVQAAIHQLTPLEAAVIRGRFGIGCDKQTKKAMAVEFKMHPQKIGNIRHKAIVKLHRLLGAAP